MLGPQDPISPQVPTHFFDVFFDTTVDGIHSPHQAHFEIFTGQPLLFDNIVIGPPQSPAFHVTFDLLNSGTVLDAPLNTLTITGTRVVPEPGTLAILALAVPLLMVIRRRT